MDVFYFIVRNVIPTQIKIVKFKSKCQLSGVNKDLKIQSSCYRLLHPHCKMLQSELEVFMEYVAVSVSVSVFICSLTAPGWTLRHWQNVSLTNPMFIRAVFCAESHFEPREEVEFPSSVKGLMCFEPRTFLFQRKVLTYLATLLKRWNCQRWTGGTWQNKEPLALRSVPI